MGSGHQQGYRRVEDRGLNDLDREQDVGRVMKGPPSGYFVIVPPGEGAAQAVSFGTAFSLLLRSWKILLGATVFGAAIAVGISFLMVNTYRAQSLVAPVDQSGRASGGMRNQLGGIAALAGIELGANGGKREEAYATLASQGFARDFIMKHDLMPVLFPDQWDAAAKHWRPGKKPPSVEEAVKKFTLEVRSLAEDKKNGLVTLTMEWRSPELVAQWANGMVEMVNERLRTEAINNANESIEYLEKELAKTGVVELRQAIYQLIEQQVNNAMVANVQREYAFHFIDKAVVPESRVSPKRTVMTIVGAIFGLFIAAVAVLLRSERKRLPVTSVTSE